MAAPIKRLLELSSLIKLLASLSAAVIGIGLTYAWTRQPVVSLLVGWDVFGLSFLVMSVLTFYHASADYVRHNGMKEDVSKGVIFTLVLASSILSLSVVLSVLNHRFAGVFGPSGMMALYLSDIFFSWVLLHIVFTFHYAHLYYGDNARRPPDRPGPLLLPGTHPPDYFDFAYFSFTIGMTYQVSDITITSRAFRRLVLLHSVLSFAFNTVILAVTINAVLQ
jgi:uncharacterized membrane protein